MKLRGAKQIHYDAGPNMIPLVDVVMVILIFLMMTGSFGAAEHFMVSNVPTSAKGMGGTPPPPNWVPPTEVSLRVEPVGGNYVVAVGDRRISDPAVLAQTLAAMHAQFPDPDSVQVIINPTRDVEYKYLIQVYDAAMSARFTKIGFGTAGLYR
jgi:biopolymer transport protein ExbD